MLAAYFEQTGPPDVLQIGALPDPTIKDDEVLIAGQYASVNPIDCYLRSGSVPANLPRPYVPGSDLAGVIVAVGSKVHDLAVGDRVWTTLQGFAGRQGTMSERFVCSRSDVYRLPEGVEFRTAAAVGLVGMTAFIGLVEKARLATDERLVIRGGSGAVGLAAIQIAKLLGAKVVASAGSSEKAQACREAGADHVIDYLQAPWFETVREIFPDGVDVVWDATRSPDLVGACQILRNGGRVVLMAGREAQAILPVGAFYTREHQILGLMAPLASRESKDRGAIALSRWMEREGLRLPIAAEFPLDEIAAAHRLQESATIEGSAKIVGKIVIRLPEG